MIKRYVKFGVLLAAARPLQRRAVPPPSQLPRPVQRMPVRISFFHQQTDSPGRQTRPVSHPQARTHRIPRSLRHRQLPEQPTEETSSPTMSSIRMVLRMIRLPSMMRMRTMMIPAIHCRVLISSPAPSARRTTANPSRSVLTMTPIYPSLSPAAVSMAMHRFPDRQLCTRGMMTTPSHFPSQEMFSG